MIGRSGLCWRVEEDTKASPEGRKEKDEKCRILRLFKPCSGRESLGYDSSHLTVRVMIGDNG